MILAIDGRTFVFFLPSLILTLFSLSFPAPLYPHTHLYPPTPPLSSSIVALTPDLLACTLTRGSSDSLALLVPSTGLLTELESPFVGISQLRRVSASSIAAIVGKSNEVPAVVVIDLADAIAGRTRIDESRHVRLLARSSDLVSSDAIPSSFLSIPRDIEFPTTLPDGSRATSHAIFFPPTNPHFRAPAGSSPPCILKIHGGPTSSAPKQMALQINYWTSRGYAVCFVNYGGSTGYGRQYMLRLMDNWGVVDVQDCAAAVAYLGSPRDVYKTRVSDEDANAMTATAKEQFKSLETRYDSNGSVQVILSGHAVDWQALDVVALPAVAAAGAFLAQSSATAMSYLHHLLPAAWTLPAAAAASATAYVAYKLATAVLSESAWASRNFGIQLETTRGFRVPFTNRRIALSRTTQHVPRDRLLDLGLFSAVSAWTIRDYLAVGVRSHPVHDAPVSTSSSAVLRAQRILFPHLAPRLPVIKHIYKALYPALFPASSNPVEAAAAAKIPNLKPLPAATAAPTTPLPPLADPTRMLISGGSAGGFTVLACLSLHPRLFAAGTSSYGVADLTALAAESHKFESQYVYRLLSGTPEQVPQVYHDRSPLNHAHKITSPLLVLQGSEDKIVPPNQARMIVDKIKQQKGGDERVKYIEFQGEGHGFRQSQNVITALVEEERWYREKLRLDG